MFMCSLFGKNCFRMIWTYKARKVKEAISLIQ